MKSPLLPHIDEIEETVESAPEKKMEAKSGGIRLPIPDGFKMPQGKREGDTVEILAKVRPMKDHLMLDEINGIPVSDAEEEEMEEKPETADEEADKNADMMAHEDGDEQFRDELDNAIKNPRAAALRMMK